MRDISIYQGESKTISFTIRDKAGAAQDITGMTITWRLSKAYAPTLMLEKPGVIQDGPAGTVDVSVTAEDMADLLGEYVHELRVVLDANVTTVFQGDVKVLRSIF